jgi:hypothetical protein
MFLVEAMASVLDGGDMADPQAVKSAPTIEELLKGLLFREVVSLSPGRYRSRSALA